MKVEGLHSDFRYEFDEMFGGDTSNDISESAGKLQCCSVNYTSSVHKIAIYHLFLQLRLIFPRKRDDDYHGQTIGRPNTEDLSKQQQQMVYKLWMNNSSIKTKFYNQYVIRIHLKEMHYECTIHCIICLIVSFCEHNVVLDFVIRYSGEGWINCVSLNRKTYDACDELD